MPATDKKGKLRPLEQGGATETTLGEILVELALKADLTETQPVSVSSLPLPSGAATSSKQDDIITEVQKLIGFEIPAYDYIALTYVAAGNGEGEIETSVFKTGGAGGTIVATLTLGYDASDRLNSVTKT